MKKNFFLLILVLLSFVAYSQPESVSTVDSLDKKYYNWFNLSPDEKIQGAWVDKAYTELLNSRKPAKKVVVAVIDGGVDINHPELTGLIWTNSDEIAGNGIDDDNNGYTDDINGWNFIGGANGDNILYETMEYVRILKELTPKYGNIADKGEVAPSDMANYELYLKVKKEYDDEYNNYSTQKTNITNFEERIKRPREIIQKYLNKEKFTIEDLKGIKSDNELVKLSKDYLLDRYKTGFTFEWLDSYKKHINEYLDYRLNMDFDPRSTIVKDNPTDINDRNYGNNDVKGPRPFHGTACSGIIAANRANGIGIKGVASNAEIMVLRAVPDGDERDKDVALAIRYAVDNGANIISMSFGKYYSLYSRYMDDAIRYADEHNVLLIHSAGNESSNVDEVPNFPSPNFVGGGVAKNMITVGATTYKADKKFCGSFTNYGKKNVDIFAPGVDIVTTFPENKYSQGDGTSYAGPVVSGVAAMVWSYFPNLTASELKDILLKSATKYPKLKVIVPNKEGLKDKTYFTELSTSGGTINAYQAIQEAIRRTAVN
jgi:subtilisin family serine protease